MSKQVFRKLGDLIHREYGIKMPDSKMVMLQGRLQKRLRALGVPSFEDYCDFVLGPQGQKTELYHMIDVVSTNKTDFFRERNHFDFLVQQALPQIVRRDAGSTTVNIWSAGCSSGQEPYTLAMVLSDYFAKKHGWRYAILGTDISTRMLKAARCGIFTKASVEPVPHDMLRKYVMRSKDRSKGVVRIVPELRKQVRFQRLNFMDDSFGLQRMFDVIFCRNVIIYFDQQTQETLLNKFCRHLRPGGYLFLGHSESVHSLNTPLKQVAPTIYRCG